MIESTHTHGNGIPICPYCQIPTIREAGYSMQTDVYYPPIYNEKGENINPDRNAITMNYRCRKCNKDYSITGNYVSGWEYVNIDKN